MRRVREQYATVRRRPKLLIANGFRRSVDSANVHRFPLLCIGLATVWLHLTPSNDGVSSSLARRFENLPSQVVADPESSLCRELVEQGTDRSDVPLALCVEHDAEQADETQSESVGDFAPALLVDQHEICALLQRNCECLRFTEIEIDLQLSD